MALELARIRRAMAKSLALQPRHRSTAAACAPDPARDANLLSRSRRTATGGWIVRLTDAPLDLDNPAHLDALMRAYERFPAIGGRSAP